MSNTLLRQWHMLRLIPRHPAKVTPSDLHKRLADEGFDTTERTIQRDLKKLVEIYPLESDERNKPYGWSWARDAATMDIPGMDSHTALAFWLAGQHLKPLLPKPTLNQLQPHFKTATHVLDGIVTNKGTPAWRNKVRVLPKGPERRSPSITEAVQNNVYDALLRNRRLIVTYNPRWEEGQKEYEINPLGIVIKDGLTYLVCSMWDYTDIKLLLLHRILASQILDKPVIVPAEFNLDDYIASGELAFSMGEDIKLKALFSSDAAFPIEECPLSDDQAITDYDNDRKLVTATVQDTYELRWWLLGFGDQVEVLEPPELRNYFAGIASNMAEAYSDRN